MNEALFMTPGIALVKAATLGDDKAIDGIVHVVERHQRVLDARWVLPSPDACAPMPPTFLAG